jgi:hypothetical protein
MGQDLLDLNLDPQILSVNFWAYIILKTEVEVDPEQEVVVVEEGLGQSLSTEEKTKHAAYKVDGPPLLCAGVRTQ